MRRVRTGTPAHYVQTVRDSPLRCPPPTPPTAGPGRRVLRTSSRTEIGARLTLSVNAHTYARRRRRRHNVGRVLVLNTPPAWCHPMPLAPSGYRLSSTLSYSTPALTAVHTAPTFAYLEHQNLRGVKSGQQTYGPRLLSAFLSLHFDLLTSALALAAKRTD